MDPNYLCREELEYELTVRGRANLDACSVRKLRDTLSEILSTETKNDLPTADSFKPEPMSEIEFCTGQVELLREISNKDYLDTKLNHLLGRLARVKIEDTHLLAARKNLRDQLHAIEASLEPSIDRAVKTEEGASSISPPPPTNIESSNRTPARPKSIPVSQWHLTFNGDISRQSVSSFVERVDEFSRSRHVTREELFDSAVELFEAEALIWFRSIKTLVHCWDDVVKQLRIEYEPADYESELWDEIKARKQDKNERVGVYFAAMINLFSRLPTPTSEKDKLRIVRRNLDPYYIQALSLTDVESVSELLNLCRRLENNKWLADNSASSPARTQSRLLEPDLASKVSRPPFKNTPWRRNAPLKAAEVTQSTKNSVECWNCSAKGHRFRNCPTQLKKFCFSCGNVKHLASACPKNAVKAE